MTFTRPSEPSNPLIRTWRAIVSEAVKLTTLRSNLILAAMAFFMIVGSATLSSLAMLTRLTDPRFAGQVIEAQEAQFVDSVLWAQVLVAVVAILAITREYSSGQIRTTLLSVPTRTPVLVAKSAVVAVGAFVLGIVAGSLAFAISTPVLTGTDVVYEFDLGEATRLSLVCGVVLAATGLLALGLATVLRNVVAALAVAIPTLTILPAVIGSIPADPIRDAARFFPTAAASALIHPDPATAPWQAGVALAVWALGALLLGGILLRLRDA